jgi:hypothetical protein
MGADTPPTPYTAVVPSQFTDLILSRSKNLILSLSKDDPGDAGVGAPWSVLRQAQDEAASRGLGSLIAAPLDAGG